MCVSATMGFFVCVTDFMHASSIHALVSVQTYIYVRTKLRGSMQVDANGVAVLATPASSKHGRLNVLEFQVEAAL